jgi:hypothetical protein
MRKLCAALVVMSLVGMGVLFAWPETVPTSFVSDASAWEPPRAQGTQGAPALRRTQPLATQVQPAQPPAAAPTATATASVAASQETASVRPQTRPRKVRRVQRTRQAAQYSRQVARLEKAREKVQAAGNPTDIASVERALSRAHGRMARLPAAGERSTSSEALHP